MISRELSGRKRQERVVRSDTYSLDQKPQYRVTSDPTRLWRLWCVDTEMPSEHRITAGETEREKNTRKDRGP
ncbi:hypothetical protein chiPu_0030910 [Chiloscyllium punctatum]|uniref:Uncharacterized protein n=1 Tax=Chiloscyllium punctatum TaxID=137246 RepID=A0A401TV90_CHIPU|nr:hypothetical protein [Chiloscyllium punctatum]